MAEFKPTHVIGDAPVIERTDKTGKVFYTNVKGQRVAPGPDKLFSVYVEGSPGSEAEEERALAARAKKAKPLGGRKPFKLTLEELGVCAEACRNMNRHEGCMGRAIAIYVAQQEVIFSRREEGVDIRRRVWLPDTVMAEFEPAE